MKTTDRQLKCRAMFEAHGFPTSGACALVGNFCRESGEDLPSAFRKTNLDHGSNGLPQWRLERLTNYMNYVKGLKPHVTPDEVWEWYGNMQLQVDYVVVELKKDYPALYAKLMAGGDVSALTADVCWQFERPSKALSGIDIRIAYAKALAAVKVAASKALLVARPVDSVVDHLEVQAKAHAVSAQGGAVAATLAAVSGAGVFVGRYVPLLPTWEVATLTVLALVVLLGVSGALISAEKARNVRAAIAGVTPDAPPAAEVAVTPVPAPDPITSVVTAKTADIDTNSPEFTAAVRAAVEAMMAKPPAAATDPVLVATQNPVATAAASLVDPKAATYTLTAGEAK